MSEASVALDPKVVKQAIQWMMRLRAEGPSPSISERIEHWRSSHLSHEVAWQRVTALDHDLREDFRALPAPKVALDALENSARRLSRRQAMKLLSGVAVIGSAGLLGAEVTPWRAWAADYATSVGERRTIALPDGSQLTLNTNSAVDLAFDGVQKQILLRRGEVLVRCAPGEISRPLRVSNRDGTFDAGQGRFIVRQEADCTTLQVLAGEVEVLHRQLVGAHRSVRVDHAGQVTPFTPLMDPGAWAEGLIATPGMPLRAFLQEVARYRGGFLKCDDEVADLRLSGVFRLEDTDQLLQLLPRTLPVRIVSRTRWWVRVEKNA